MGMVAITLKLQNNVLGPAQTRALRVISDSFGAWDYEHSAVMHQSKATPMLWALPLQLPRGALQFAYKYAAVDTNGLVWEEAGVRVVSVQALAMSGGVQQDVIDRTML